MAVSEMIKTLVSEAVQSGDVGQLDYVRGFFEAMINDIVDDDRKDVQKTPEWLLDLFRDTQLDALNDAIEAARFEITREKRKRLMTTSELNRVIRVYKFTAAAVYEANIGNDVLEALPHDQGDAIVTAQDALTVARRNLARVIWAHTDALKIEDIEEMAND